MNRKTFLHRSLLTLSGLAVLPKIGISSRDSSGSLSKPMVISTWNFGMAANETAWEVISKGGRALDAVEKGVQVTELDPNITSVGYGGFPDREGIISLDACIMNEGGDCGSVTFLQHIKTPISVARMVMEKSPHVMLSGEGALQFALARGFKKEELHTERSKQRWERWRKNNSPMPVDADNHDTISMLAIDQKGDLSGACTTSGTAWKYHGRVGDSPIIGAGLYVDNEIGAAGATGTGEVIMKIVGSHAIVECMRHGYSPQEACQEVVQRALKKVPDARHQPIYFIALNKDGEFGAYGTNAAFNYAVYTEEDGNRLCQASGAF